MEPVWVAGSEPSGPSKHCREPGQVLAACSARPERRWDWGEQRENEGEGTCSVCPGLVALQVRISGLSTRLERGRL